LEIIDDALLADRDGSAVLETILTRQNNTMPGFSSLGLKEVISVGCWYLWWMRRQRTHGEPVPPISKCKISILSIASNAALPVLSWDPEGSAQWKKPEPRHVKLNVNASFYAETGAGAAGAIIRDFRGTFVAAAGVFISHVASASMAEALAMKHGLELANRLGLNRVQAESDSTEVIEACNGEGRWWSDASTIYANCVDLVTTIGSVSFSHCPREANHVAHEIASFCFSNRLSSSWDDDPPSFIIDKIVNDVTVH
jgi:ribonuclease HI